MALAIDASSPAIATQTNGATATVATASFTPPNNSLLLIRWAANSTSLPAQPTISGGSLTYTLQDWKSKADTPTRDGQAACWIASVATGASMTVTVTNQATSGFREAALRVVVLTGHNTSTPIGAHGKSGSASASSIAQTYTASATGGQGFISVADWDALSAMTAGTGCTLEGSGTPGGAVTYGFVRRTSADDSTGVSNTLNVTVGGTSTNLSWVWAEVLPAAGGSTFNQSVSGTVTPAGGLARSAGKVAAGTVTPAGVLVRRPGKVFAGTVTPAGVLATIKAVLRSFTGTVTPTGAAVRQAQKPLAGSTTPAGVLVRQPQKRMTGTVTPAGTVATIKAVLRSFAGAVTPTGALTRSAGKAAGGTVTPTGVLARRPAKILAGSVTPVGVLTKVRAALVALAGTVTPAGTLRRATAKVLAGTVTPAGVAVKLLARTFAGTVAAVGALAKRPAKSFGGSVTPTGVVAMDEGAAPSIVPRPFTGTVSRPNTGIVTRPNTGTVPRP